MGIADYVKTPKKIPGPQTHPPTIALLHWGDVWEDFLDPIGISLETFCKEGPGGWMLGYIDALRLNGIRTVLFCISARVRRPMRITSTTGVNICVLPAGRAYLAIRKRAGTPSSEKASHKGPIRRSFNAALSGLAPYIATPLLSLVRELRREKCSAVLSQEYEYARFDVCVVLGKILRIPVFATFQGGDRHLGRLEDFIRRFTIAACSGLIIAPGTEIQRVRCEYEVPYFKMARIFNPIDLNVWSAQDRSQARASAGISPLSRVVVWHGRVDIHRKGLDVLLDAWELVRRKHNGQELRLLLIGNGADAGELRRRIGAMKLEGVTWVNNYITERAVIRTYLSAGDIYVLPSRHEGFPVAPVEAMAAGLPLVAADAPGIPDILEGGENAGGIMVPKGDPQALAAALGRLLDNAALCRELGLCARRRAEEFFSLDEVGKQLCGFFAKRGMKIPGWQPGHFEDSRCPG